ncbi:MAG: hypothetical protein R6V10_02315 [bacterium]
MDDEDKVGNVPDGEERLEDHEAELSAREAEEELREESGRISEREYQKMAADLRWEVLEYVDAHPDKSVREIAEFFGIKEGTIRAWKAHSTMGTYGKKSSRDKSLPSPGGQRPLFKEEKEESPPPYLSRKRHSNFIHYFDKTPPGIVCPHFYILAHANGCPFACHYCYLKLTLRHYPEPTVFTNTARMFQEIREWLMSLTEPAVLNTGELSDSLGWDMHTRLSKNLVPLFENQNKHKLLFLTKSAQVDNLLKMEPTKQVVVSFSVNASKVSEMYEKASPPPEKRLDAARRVKEHGYEVRLRLDPMIPVEGWEKHYADIIEKMNRVDPAIVTLGSLRYFRNLTNHTPKDTDVFEYGHDHGDPDGRLRIERDTRLEMYRFCLDRLPSVRVGLCKETADVHRELGLPGVNQSCNCTPE